jgi:hypothetical protein
MSETRERRGSEADLELARGHLIEILERLQPLIRLDEEKNDQFREILKDLKKIQGALDLKKLYGNLHRRLEDLNISPTGAQRPEDQQEIKKLLMELTKIPGDLIDE